MTARTTLRRLHVWLGWLVGIPILFWTASGLWMVARPIEEVRGTALRRDPPSLVLPRAVVAPDAGTRPLKALTIEQRAGGPIWIASFADGGVARAAIDTGRWLPPVSEAEARALARAAYAPRVPIASMARTPADRAPIDLRRPRPAWGARFADGTNVYVDADSGAVLAVRTEQWRWFDWMWGLHIMDLESREETSHPILIGFAALAVVTVLLALVLLPMTRRRRR